MSKESDNLRVAIAGIWIMLWFFAGLLFMVMDIITFTSLPGYPAIPNYGPSAMLFILWIGSWILVGFGALIDVPSARASEIMESDGYFPSSARYEPRKNPNCPRCGGNGRCTTCGGSGVVGGAMRARNLNSQKDYSHSHNCASCGGTGACMTCMGHGKQVQDKYY
jgi:hypothetical protein